MSNIIDLDFFQRFGIIFSLGYDEVSFLAEDYQFAIDAAYYQCYPQKRQLYYAFSKENVVYLGIA